MISFHTGVEQRMITSLTGRRVIIELKTFLQFWHYTFGNVGMSAKYWLTDFHKKVKLDLYLII